MAKWSVYGKVVASTYIGEFEAETKEEALDKAGKEAHVSVCHQCSRKIEDPEVTDMTAVIIP